MNLVDEAHDKEPYETILYLHCSCCGATSTAYRPQIVVDVSSAYSLDYWETPLFNGVKKLPPIKTKRKQLRKRSKI